MPIRTPSSKGRKHQGSSSLVHDPIRNSVLLPALQLANTPTFRVRPISPEEIQKLEQQGCRSSDWTRVQVSEDFLPDRISQVEFRGDLRIGRFFGTVTWGGITENTGLYRTVLQDCWIEDGVLIRDTILVAGMRIAHGVSIVGCGVISHHAGANFGVGAQISLVETGGRVTRSFPEMTLAEAERTARPGGNIRGLLSHLRRIEAYAARAASPYGVIQSHSVVVGTPRVENVFVGESSQILHATSVSNSVILSEGDSPTIICDGSIVSDSAIQWGCRVSGLSIVEGSVLCEQSQVDRHGKVLQSIIGPNSTIAEGEVSSSLVGPFVGFHHQALLIGVVWPEGKGNIAYGCNCGSNHTGKAPDQEFWPGEGLFLGLGVNVKYPGCFVDAPYSMVATGVTLLPQNVGCPFSLILAPPDHPPGIPVGYNEIIPGWVLNNNLFSIRRNEKKFKARDKSKRMSFEYRILRKDIIEKMVRVSNLLKELSGKNTYTDKDCPILGKNFLREESRREAVEVYDFHVLAYALAGYYQQLLLNPTEDPFGQYKMSEEWRYQRNILKHNYDERTPQFLLRQHLEFQKKIAHDIEISKARDDIRGKKIIPDYADHHITARDHPFIQETWKEIEELEDSIMDLLDRESVSNLSDG